jgi:pteridine reductase
VELGDRVALVTGAGRRLGRAIAVGLARRGARVGVHYNASADGARAAVEEIRSAGGDAEAFGADLTDATAAGPLIDRVGERWGGLDILINSAGIMQRTPVGSVTPAQWDQIFAVNLRAPFFMAQAAGQRMAERAGGGVIVNIADLAALETWSAYVPHGISKAGVVQMTRALAHALAPRVRVNAVAPGAVLLPSEWDAAAAEHLAATTPLRRLGAPEDVVQAVVYLIQADYVTGETLVVDGGRRVRV